MKYYAIGDVHGMVDMLKELLAKIKIETDQLDPQDWKVIFLGDYVDRGPKSKQTVQIVKDLVESFPDNYIAILGNHETFMIENHRSWIPNGGAETLASYNMPWQDRQEKVDPEDRKDRNIFIEHCNWLAKLPLTYQTENYFFCHAGINPRYQLDEQRQNDLLWIRYWETMPDLNNEAYHGPKHIVYGHTVSKVVFQDNPWATCLDTGACFEGYGTLTCGVFDSELTTGPERLIQIKTDSKDPWRWHNGVLVKD